ncbi:Protein EXPORTIN 1A [Camellia lanceoleosa]|uniref:Protein EXPORTIN 1A n=1 Tax=Camellia lanceoleosa TaxID=1840588 RepID=A0ACC0HJ71_9ERIC|nr:Protein EXPORTIN 1A [Camellia lanceoleosa]
MVSSEYKQEEDLLSDVEEPNFCPALKLFVGNLPFNVDSATLAALFERIGNVEMAEVLESSQENISALLLGLEYLINISYVDDTEVFKVCLDYWNSLLLELFEAHHNLDDPVATVTMMGLQLIWFFVL